MDDDLDIEALLEASYAKQDENRKSESPENEKRKKHKKKKRNDSRERSHKKFKEQKNSHRDRSHSRDRDRKSSPREKDLPLSSEDRRYKQRRSPSPSHARQKYSRNSYGPRRDYYRGSYNPRDNPRDNFRDSSRDNPRDNLRDNPRDHQSRRSSRNHPEQRSRFRSRSRSRSKERKSDEKPKRGSSPVPKKEKEKEEKGGNPDLTPEERDMRTVFCMQLSQRVRARDLEEFFSPVGKIQDVRIILDNKTRRSKGIAYVEFQDTFSVSLAVGLSGKKLLGIPIIVQLTQAEKNRTALLAMSVQRGNVGPMKLYVGSLHFNVTEEMLKGIFEPFGKIDKIELIKDTETGRSKGYGFVTFHDSDSAKKALDQLNGLELAGKPMKVSTVTEHSELIQGSYLDTEEMDRAGIELGATGRLKLMAKLAEGTGFELPQAAVKALQLTAQAQSSPMSGKPAVSVATKCFMLSNMFDPAKETSSTWDEDIKNDVIEECRNHGGALHVHVDKNSPDGNVYVKCPSLTAAAATVRVLHGRYFAGRVINATYVPEANYQMLFPDSAAAVAVL